jgi:iron complex outermembrane receptor protein
MICILTGFNPVCASENLYRLNIPAAGASEALDRLAQATGYSLFYPTDDLASVTTNALDGSFTLPDALDILLEGTHLNAVVTEKGVIVISTAPDTQQSNSDEGSAMKESQKKFSILAGIATFLTAIVTSPNVAGQETRESGAQKSTIEEVIVTAQKREERLQDVPISISAYSAKDMEAKSLNSLQELAQFTPNLTYSNHPSSARTGAIIYMRGVGQGDSNVYWDPGVAIYLDGVYMGRMQGLDLDLLDLERVEVLRGPQGTLYGRNTIGGAINVVSAKPTDEFEGYAQVTTGRYDRIDGKVSVNVPIVPGKLAAKFAGDTLNRDGYGERFDFFTGKKIDEMGDIESLSGRAMLNWKPGDNLDILFSVDAQRAREFGAVHKLPEVGLPPLAVLYNNVVNPDPNLGAIFLTDNDFTTYETGGNANELDAFGTSLTVELNLDKFTFKSLTGYRQVETFHLIAPDGTPYTVLDSTQSVDQDQFSQEFNVIGTAFDNRMDWILGLYYFQEDAIGNRRADIYPELFNVIGLEITAKSFTRNEVESWATFGQFTYTLTDKLNITSGMRYTSDSKDVTGSRDRPATGVILVPLQTKSDSWEAITGRIGFEYHWIDEIMTYFSAARGFKSGGINGEPQAGSGFLPFNPEYIWTYEAGFKSELLDRRLRFNAALFYSDFTDIQFNVFRADQFGNFITTVGNAAKARIMGLEADITALPAPGLTLNAQLGLLDAEYTEVNPGTPVTEDTEFSQTPKLTVSTSAQYQMPINTWGDLIARLDYVYKSKIHYDTANASLCQQDAFGLLNGRLTFENANANWSVSVFGTNLTDERYFLACGTNTGSLGFSDLQYARPREWGASLTYRF